MNTRPLCKGFQTTRVDGAIVYATLYAQLANGSILESNEFPLFGHGRVDHDFDRKTRTWKEAEEMPEGREFIGHYVIPQTQS